MMESLPNRQQRRKLAKKLGLFKKEARRKKNEEPERAQAVGKLLQLRNLTEQRNRDRKKKSE